MIIQFLLLFLLPSVSIAQAIPGDVYIDCGSSAAYRSNGLDWVPDTAYVYAGTSRNVTTNLIRALSTVRTFPLENNILRKFCFEIPVRRRSKYLVRTTYYYGGLEIRNPPVFDQIVDGVLWSVVNTTEEYASGNVSYYEGIFRATGNNLSVCLAANTYTDSDPFISALEVVPLLDQLYNSTNFSEFSLSLVARHNFGYSGLPIGYPDDQFGRYWEPFGGNNTSPPLTSEDLVASGMWNLPPSAVFSTRLEGGTAEPLTLMWPPHALPVPPQGFRQDYYIALYFAEDLTSAPGIQRIFDITINGVTYYSNLSVTPAGISVFANRWPLSGITNLTLTSSGGSSAGPLINAGEVFQVLPAGNRTHTRDVVAVIALRSNFENPPLDWHGDPCLPREYAWTGVTCSYDVPRIRIVTLNLTSMGIAGSISPMIVNITALNTILLGNNSLSGTIPDLSLLRGLRILHLEDNLLTGPIPPSLGDLTNISEIYLQNNNLTGQVPSDLPLRSGLDLRYSPGNPLLTPPS